MKTLKELVNKYLNDIPQTRNNDNLLIAYVVRDMYGIQNTFDIALTTNSNIYESIRRERARIQNELNPELQADENVRTARLEKEQRMREEYR